MKKLRILGFLMIGLTFFIMNCKKNVDAKNDIEKSGTSTPRLGRAPLTSEIDQVKKIFKTDYWKAFSGDNPTIVKYLNTQAMDVSPWYDTKLKLNMIKVLIPVVDAQNNSYVALAGLQSDFDAANFNKMYIEYVKNTSLHTLPDTTTYGTSHIEIYGVPSDWTYTETLYGTDSLTVTVTHASTYTYLNSSGFASLGIVVPTVACINAGFNNIVEDEGGSLMHHIKNVLLLDTLELADFTSAALWCAFHNNTEWPYP